jgi:hypothetical protein
MPTSKGTQGCEYKKRTFPEPGHTLGISVPKPRSKLAAGTTSAKRTPIEKLQRSATPSAFKIFTAYTFRTY